MKRLVYILCFILSVSILQAQFLNVSSGSVEIGGYSAEYQAVYDQYTDKPEDPLAVIWDRFVDSIVNGAYPSWGEVDRLFVFMTHTNTNSEALLDWKNPTGTGATIPIEPIFTQNIGFQGSALGPEYINTNYNPVVHGVNYTLNDAGISYYSLTDVQSNNADYGAYSTGTGYIWGSGRTSTDKVGITINDATFSMTIDASSSLGMMTHQRNASNEVEAFLNKVSLGTSTPSSTSMPNDSIFIMCYNNNGTPNQYATVPRQFSMFAIHSSLSQGHIDNLSNAFQQAVTSIDALVPTLNDSIYQFIFEGNSLTWQDIYPRIVQAWYDDEVSWNVAVSGTNSGEVLARITDSITSKFDPTFDYNVVISWIGVNDASDEVDTLTVKANMQEIYDSVTNAGYDMIIIGLSDLGYGYNTWATPINIMFRNNWSSFSDGFVDIIQDSRFQDATDTDYFYDEIHMTIAGYMGVAELLKPYLDVLLE